VSADIVSEGIPGKSGVRRPYVKPFVGNLDAVDTEGKFPEAAEFTPGRGTLHFGPS
jgi:hypothetical protein